MNRKYNEIMGLPHHVSKTRPQMPMSDRAAQFAPFAALTGYDAAIKETGRLTDERIELDVEALSTLDMKLDYSQVSGHVFSKNLSRSSCLGLLPV